MGIATGAAGQSVRVAKLASGCRLGGAELSNAACQRLHRIAMSSLIDGFKAFHRSPLVAFFS